MMCEVKTRTILETSGISVGPEITAVINLLCQSGASPEWIAEYCLRLVTLKDVIDGIKSAHPSLAGAQLDKLAELHLRGASPNEIYQVANAMMASPTPPGAPTIP